MADYRTINARATLTNMAVTAQAVLSTSVAYSPLPRYEGAYEVTPSAEVQTLATEGLVMDGNVRVNPIPSNYGLITWNGSTLTVS